MSELLCPNCTNPIKDTWKFCRSCGHKLIGEEAKKENGFDPEEIYKILAIRKKRREYQNKVREYKEDVTELKERYENGFISLDVYEDEAKKLKKRQEALINLKSEFEGIPETLHVEVLMENINEAKTSLKTLQNLKKSKEYNKGNVEGKIREKMDLINDLQNQHKSAITWLKHWKQNLISELKEFRDEVEKIDISKKIGDLTDEEYSRQKNELHKKIVSHEVVIQELSNMGL